MNVYAYHTLWYGIEPMHSQFGLTDLKYSYQNWYDSPTCMLYLQW